MSTCLVSQTERIVSEKQAFHVAIVQNRCERRRNVLARETGLEGYVGHAQRFAIENV